MSADERSPNWTFTFHRVQRDRFRMGELGAEWAARYPMLFDKDDVRILATEHQRKYHFLEWLAAILLYEATGYFSLVEGYTARSHDDKLRQLEGVVGPGMFEELLKDESGQPDLFVFHPVAKHWFFCEVKGPGDKERVNQRLWIERFNAMAQKHGLRHNVKEKTKLVRFIELRNAGGSVKEPK